MPLHAGGLVALFAATGLVDDPDVAQRVFGETVEGIADDALESFACGLVLPFGGDEELLHGADGGPAGQGDRFDALAGQVGKQPFTIVVEVLSDPLLSEAVAVRREVFGERGSEVGDLLVRHGWSSCDSLWIPRATRAVVLSYS